LENDFSLISPERQRWNSFAARYNATTLTNVLSEYMYGYSAGDVGKPILDYVPLAGYVGTLAPGEKFIEAHPVHKLPKKVLHPWPAMQQIQWHCRMPVTHPMIPPPVLWLALNNMYTDVSTSHYLLVFIFKYIQMYTNIYI
jgi:hypothetical protein